MLALVFVAAVNRRPLLYATGLYVDGGQPTVSPTLFEPAPAPPLDPPPGAGLIGVASAPTPGRVPQPTKLAQRINAVPLTAVGSGAWLVMNADSGQALAEKNATAAMMPASTLKVLTCLAAVEVVGADTRFTTKVVSPTAGSIVLVGGGDPMLKVNPVTTGYPRPASLSELAAETARALRASGRTSVTLGYDASLFTGPSWAATWPGTYRDQVAPISALWADKGRVAGVGFSPDPARAAADAFAAQLNAQGITVRGVATPAKGSGTELAAVQSMPLGVLAQEALIHSDNSYTEVILRQLALGAGQPASFDGGITALNATLTTLKLTDPGAVFHDGSGLSRSNRVSARMLAQAVRLITSEPKYRVLLDGFPVAGATGTLHARFTDAQAAPAKGWARAKTGTLTGVSTLAGLTRTRDGAPVVFAFMANNSPDVWGAKVWADAMTGAVTGCGC